MRSLLGFWLIVGGEVAAEVTAAFDKAAEYVLGLDAPRW